MRILLLEDGLLKNKNSLPIDNEDQKQATFSIVHETLHTSIQDYRVTLYSTETVDQALELLRNPSVNDINKINTAWERSFFARRELFKKNPSGAVWQWKDFPCLAHNRDLVHNYD